MQLYGVYTPKNLFFFSPKCFIPIDKRNSYFSVVGCLLFCKPLVKTFQRKDLQVFWYGKHTRYTGQRSLLPRLWLQILPFRYSNRSERIPVTTKIYSDIFSFVVVFLGGWCLLLLEDCLGTTYVILRTILGGSYEECQFPALSVPTTEPGHRYPLLKPPLLRPPQPACPENPSGHPCKQGHGLQESFCVCGFYYLNSPRTNTFHI